MVTGLDSVLMGATHSAPPASPAGEIQTNDDYPISLALRLPYHGRTNDAAPSTWYVVAICPWQVLSDPWKRSQYDAAQSFAGSSGPGGGTRENARGMTMEEYLKRHVEYWQKARRG